MFGFVYWFLDGILDDILVISFYQTGDTFDLFVFLWAGIIVVYLVFGGWWLIRMYNESQYQSGGGL